MGIKFYEGWTEERWNQYAFVEHHYHYITLMGLRDMIRYIKAHDKVTVVKIAEQIGNYEDSLQCAQEYVMALIRDGQITVDHDGIISLI